MASKSIAVDDCSGNKASNTRTFTDGSARTMKLRYHNSKAKNRDRTETRVSVTATQGLHDLSD